MTQFTLYNQFPSSGQRKPIKLYMKTPNVNTEYNIKTTNLTFEDLPSLIQDN